MSANGSVVVVECKYITVHVQLNYLFFVCFNCCLFFFQGLSDGNKRPKLITTGDGWPRFSLTCGHFLYKDFICLCFKRLFFYIEKKGKTANFFLLVMSVNTLHSYGTKGVVCIAVTSMWELLRSTALNLSYLQTTGAMSIHSPT